MTERMKRTEWDDAYDEGYDDALERAIEAVQDSPSALDAIENIQRLIEERH